MKIAILTAVARNGAIGNNGEIPWHFPEDMKLFKKLTIGRVVIMGRKTFESIGKPLPNRLNIVVTRQNGLDLSNVGVAVVHSLEEALAFAKRMLDSKANTDDNEEVFCIGGVEIYRLAMPVADKIYLTQIDKDFNGDAFFPKIDMSVWRCVYVAGAGWHGKEPKRFLAYFLEFDRSRVTLLEK